MQPGCCPGSGRLLPGDVCKTRRGKCRSLPVVERLAALPSAGLRWAAVLLCQFCLRLPATLLVAVVCCVLFVGFSLFVVVQFVFVHCLLLFVVFVVSCCSLFVFFNFVWLVSIIKWFS